MSEILNVAERLPVAAGLRPLVVDLDGTLIRSDLLIENGFAAIGREPGILLSAAAALARGKAALKEFWPGGVGRSGASALR